MQLIKTKTESNVIVNKEIKPEKPGLLAIIKTITNNTITSNQYNYKLVYSLLVHNY